MRYEILNCLKGFAGFCRFIMKSLTYVLKITAIALNTFVSACVLLFVCSGYGGHPRSLRDWVGSILICAIPPVTLITIALTFHKKFKILTSVLKITAITLNTIFLPLVLSFVGSGFGGHPLSLRAWVSSILVLAIPPVTLITLALTFLKKFKILTSVLRIIAIILNAYLLIPLIWCRHEILDDMALEAYLIYCGLPALNLVALAVTFIKKKGKKRRLNTGPRHPASHGSRATSD